MADELKTPDPAQNLADALNNLATVTKAVSTQPTPNATPAEQKPVSTETKVEQTPVQAFKSYLNLANQQLDLATSEADKAAIRAGLNDTLTKIDADVKKMPVGDYVKKTEWGVEEAKNYLAEIGGIPKTEVKGIFSNLGAQRTASADSWRAQFGNRTPLDVLFKGAMIPDTSGPYEKAKPLIVKDDMLERARDLHDQVFVWMLHKQAQNGGMGVDPRTQCRIWPEYAKAMEYVGKALDTTDTANWVPTGFTTDLLARYDLDRNVSRQLRTFQQPRNPFDYPVMGARTTTYKISEQTADIESATAVTTSDMTPLKITLTLASLGARTSWSYELDEDSIIAIATEARNQLGISMAYSEEDALINGDTTGTHQDADVTSSSDIRKIWKGFRKYAIQQSYTTDGSAKVVETLTGMIKSMGKYGARPADLFWVCAPGLRADFLSLKDTNNNPVMIGLPVMGAGNSPMVMTLADVPLLLGLPLVVSEAFRSDLNASGVFDNTTTSKTGLLLVNRKGWIYSYSNEQPLIESQRWIRTRQIEIVASMRRAFNPIFAIASNKTVWYDYNMA